MNAFALSLALKQTLGATQKLPFVNECKKRVEGVTHEVPLFFSSKPFDQPPAIMAKRFKTRP